MQQPGTFNLDLYRGDSYAWRCRLWQDSAQSIPVDLTGVTAAAEIRERSAGALVVDLDVAITMPNIIDVSMTPAMWLECPAKGSWDLQLTYPDAAVQTVLKGTVNVTADITDSIAMPVRMRR